MLLLLYWMIINNLETGSGEDGQEKDASTQRAEWSGYSVVWHVLLPVAGLAILWGQRDIFSRLLLQLDRSCVAVYCPSLSKREKLLKWASSRLPLTWSSQARTLSSGIPELWKDGSLLCTLINSVVPGACPNPHRHWRKPPTHAQALAYKYLGLTPRFSDAQLSGDFSLTLERKFIAYLNELQHAISRWSAGADPAGRAYSAQYVARGMGLYTGDQHQKTTFYVYSDCGAAQRGSVLLYIRGPYGSSGKATVPPFHSLKRIPVVGVLQRQLAAAKSLPPRAPQQKAFLKTISLDFTSLLTAEAGDEAPGRSDIPIQVDMELDRAKVTYIPAFSGMYEISLISNGELLKGSPYSIRVTSGKTNRQDSFTDKEIDDQAQDKVTYKKRKIISQIIDCINEKIVISDQTETRPDKNLTIVAITKRDDEILKTEIKCALAPTDEPDPPCGEQPKPDAELLADEIDKIADELEAELAPSAARWAIDPQTKVVADLNEAKAKLIDLITYETNSSEDETQSSKRLKDRANEEMAKSPLSLRRLTSRIEVRIAPSAGEPPSAVCGEHTARQEGYALLSVAEKRRAFAKQESVESLSSAVSAPSETWSKASESGSGSFRELSVLHVLDSIKNSRRDSGCDAFSSFTSTASLPNITALDAGREALGALVRAKKEYWEMVSSMSSSSASLGADVEKGRKVLDKNLFNRFESEKSVEKKAKFGGEGGKTGKGFFYQSSGNVCAVPYEATPGSYKMYRSFDDSLENCSAMTIEERKRILLKEFYEKEKTPRARVGHKSNLPENKEKAKLCFLPTHQHAEKISVFTAKLVDTNKIESLPEKLAKPTPPKSGIRTQFKRALNMFKNLENGTKPIKVSKESKKTKLSISRRLSLDLSKQKNTNKKQGGSLNLPNISERFSINNLYSDVFGNRKNSFRGTPNKTALNQTLASMSTSPKKLNNSKNNNNQTQNETDDDIGVVDEDIIKYFINKSKTKQRKSIKSVFEVHY